MRAAWLLALFAGAAPGLRSQEAHDAPITSWLVSRSFPSDTGAAGLAAAVPDESTSFAADGGGSVRVARADEAGRVDLLAFLHQSSLDRQAVYSATFLVAPSERTIDLGVESDDDIAVWLNGAPVHRHVVTRAVDMETDTVTLHLLRGANRLVYKVVNRDGGFGFGGRLLGSSPDAVGDITISTDNRAVAPPAAATSVVTIGTVRVPDRATLVTSGDTAELMVPVHTEVTHWGPASDGIVTLGSAHVSTAGTPGHMPAALEIPVPWKDLARDGGAGLVARSVTAGAGSAERRIPPIGTALLDQLSRPIAVEPWRNDSAGGSLTAELEIPDVLAGLPLVLEAAEFSRAPIMVNGVMRAADSAGNVPLCAPCVSGSRIRVSIDTRGIRWWDHPNVRVPAAGWREIREGARWARRLDPAARVPLPDPPVAESLLAAAADPGKAAYLGIVHRWLDRLAPAAKTIRRDTVDVVGNSHLDVVWLWELAEGIDVLRNTWRTATKLLAKYPQMHFAGSSAYYYALLERDDPALLNSIQALVREGRWHLVGGWWVEADANLPSGESLVRQGLYGQRTLRRLFGRDAHVAWTPDTFGYPWTLPQILLASGLDGFVTQKMRWNDRNPWPASLDAFWWQGPDGSRVLTYIPYGYDHDLDPDRLAAELDSTVSGGKIRRMLVLYGVGDHGGGPTMEMLERARDLRRVPTFPVLRETAPDSALARMRRDLPDGPTVRDELYLEYHRGAYTTNGAMKWWNRRMESLLSAAEAAATMSPLPYPRAELGRAWELTLFNQMHDLLPGTSIRAVHAQAERDYRIADSIAIAVLGRSIRAALGASDTRPPDARWRSYAVFNPSAYSRGGHLRIAIAGRDSISAYDGSRRALRSVRRKDTLDVLVPPVPALGMAIVFVGPARDSGEVAATVPSRTLENDKLLVTIDSATGRIARMYDKVNRREVLRPGANALVMLEDRPGRWDAWNINHLNGRRTRVDQEVSVGRVERGLDQSLTVSMRRDSIRVTQRYVLPDGAARLDIETTIDWHTRHELLKAGFVLPFHADSVVAEIPYGAIARPTVARNSVDSARFEVPMQRWIDASAGGYGVAIVNDSKYGYDAHGDTIRISLLRAPEIPDAISDQRRHHFTYSIVPHVGDWRAPAVREAADELNDPLIAVRVDEHRGASASAPLIQLEGEGVALGALKRAEEGNAMVVRIVETEGRASSGTLHLARPSTVRQANLLEDPTGPPSPAGTAFPFQLRPWEIRTLLVSAP